MTCTVTIDLTDVSGYAPTIGDVVTFEAKNLIGSPTRPGRVITTAPTVVELSNGQGEVELEPGPMIVRIKARNYRGGGKLEATVPEDIENLTLRDLLEQSFVYEPSVIQEAQQYFARTSAVAAQVEQMLAEAIGIYDGIESVNTAVDRAHDAKDQSVAAQDSAESARDDAQSAQVAAQASQDAAKQSEINAESSANSANSSASIATQERESAENARDISDTNANQTTQDVATSLEHRIATGSARNAAQTYRDQAKGHRDAAAQSEGVATSAAEDAAQNVVSILDGHVTDAGTAAARSESAADRSETAAGRSEQAAADAEQIVLENVPTATGTAKGVVRLAGDLGGTADNPTVPGLADKADTDHTHPIADVDGLDAALNDRVPATSVGTRVYATNSGGGQTSVPYASAATGNTIPYRRSGGELAVGTPADDTDAATKAYVDGRSGTSDKIIHTYEGAEVPLSGVLDALLDEPAHAVVDTLPSNAADLPNTIFYVKE